MAKRGERRKKSGKRTNKKKEGAFRQNAFFNFLELFKQHRSDWDRVHLAVEAARKWRDMPPTERKQYAWQHLKRNPKLLAAKIALAKRHNVFETWCPHDHNQPQIRIPHVVRSRDSKSRKKRGSKKEKCRAPCSKKNKERDRDHRKLYKRKRGRNCRESKNKRQNSNRRRKGIKRTSEKKDENQEKNEYYSGIEDFRHCQEESDEKESCNSCGSKKMKHMRRNKCRAEGVDDKPQKKRRKQNDEDDCDEDDNKTSNHSDNNVENEDDNSEKNDSDVDVEAGDYEAVNFGTSQEPSPINEEVVEMEEGDATHESPSFKALATNFLDETGERPCTTRPHSASTIGSVPSLTSSTSSEHDQDASCPQKCSSSNLTTSSLPKICCGNIKKAFSFSDSDSASDQSANANKCPKNPQ